MSPPLTRVLTFDIPSRRHDFLLFGSPCKIDRLHSDESGARAVARYFEPGALFGYARQDKNEYGILRWYTYFFRASSPGDHTHLTTAAVEPSAHVLVACTTKTASITARRYVDRLDELDIDPTATVELHLRAAPYLQVGVLPDDLISDFVSRSTPSPRSSV